MIDNTELNAYHERQSKQEADIATLRSRVDRIDKDLDDFKNKDKEELNQRLRSIEKQVWGAGAVIAVLFAGVGIITQMESDDDWDDEAKIENVIYEA
tara:strand:- start:26 stop:316 length:291 start_codon:yes stop_codon:yes gene_type:complete